VVGEKKGGDMLDQYIKWVEAHERHLLILAVGLVLWAGISRIDTLVAHHDQSVASAQALVVASDVAKNAAISQQVAQDTATMKQMQAASDARQAALQAQVIDLIAKLAAQQKTDASMTPSDLTNRWNVLVPNAGATPVAAGVALPSAGALATVQQLEEIPVQAKEIDAANQRLAIEDGLLVQSQKTNADLESQVTGLKVTAVDTAKKCEDDKKVIIAQARKSKGKWFIFGFATGFGLRQYIKSSFGL
jgi:hypothetical protein